MKISRSRSTGNGEPVTGEPGASAQATGQDEEVTAPRIRRIDFRLILTRDFLRFLGPSFIVTIGFIDPGNWATNVTGGSDFGYKLIWLITLSTLMLVLFQSMAARLGIVTGHSLAYNVRRHFKTRWTALFGTTIVIACIATDVAELLGGALGFHLLFGLPLAVGGLMTAVLKIALILTGRYRHIERVIVGFIAIVAACYLIELFLVRPDWGAAAAGAFTPRLTTESIAVAVGMFGAVLMPHNLYLHSNVILQRTRPVDDAGTRRVISYEFGDTALAMGIGWVINSAMIIVAAAVFFRHGLAISDLEQASATLEPLVGSFARLLFGIGLLFAGLGSSFTSAMAEVNVLTAYLGRPEDSRTRFYRVGLFILAIPALAVVASGANSLRVLVYSQVALSLQLPLTLIPLVLLVRDRKVMGRFASGFWERKVAIAAAAAVVALNVLFLYQLAGGRL